MDFDIAWCPVCDRQIAPKRITVSVPVPAPPKPAGRPRPKPPVVMRQRTLIDQGPIPLYCSDECQLADLNPARAGAPPLDPAREVPDSAAPIKPSKKDSFSDSESSASSSSTMSSLDKLVKMYNFPPLPPPPPAFDEPAPEPAPREYNTGIMMAGKLITSLCPPPQKPFEGKYRPAQEPRKPIPGWTDGSNAWRSAVYSVAAPKSAHDPFYRDNASTQSFSASSHRPSSFRNKPSYSSSALSSAPAAMRSASDDMITKFSENFIRRSESRVSLYNNNSTATPSSPSSTRSMPFSSPPKRERSIVHPGAKGKLLVPDVKLKVHSGSSSSLSSAWTGPTSASSRRSVRSPLSATSDTDDDNDTERCDSALSRPRRPTENTRSWSYDNVKTYDIMPIPPKKVKKMEKRIVDGEEKEVEVEVEVYEERKRLFLFPPTRISP